MYENDSTKLHLYSSPRFLIFTDYDCSMIHTVSDYLAETIGLTQKNIIMKEGTGYVPCVGLMAA